MCGIVNSITGAVGGLFGGSKPDTSGMNAAALQQAELSEEELDWAKQIYADSAPDRAKAIERAGEVSDAQLASMKQNDAISRDYYDYQKGTFRPLEQGIVDAATNYDTTARRDSEAAQAQADIGSAGDAARISLARDLASRGGDVNSGNFAASLANASVREAAAKAGAGNAARKNVELQGYARKMDAANLGRGLASSQATSAGVALNAGNMSANNAASVGNITAQGNQIMNQGYGGAQQGLSGAASTYGGIAGIQNQAYANDTNRMKAMSDIGSDAASAYKLLSDKNAKKNIKPVSGKVSLAAFRKMPVSNYDYKKGRGDGGNHTGHMAQDVRKGLGDATAPGGKMIDMISLSGHQSNAIRELDKTDQKTIKAIQALGKRVAGLESARRM